MPAVGILGGTFDPVHNGHLRVALEMRERLALDAVHLVPVGTPSHRERPVASAAHRLAMLAAAIDGVDGLRADSRELERAGPSYTVDTLRALRGELGDTPLCLIIGMDQFAALDQWYEWRDIIELAHLCVARRPGVAGPCGGPLARLAAQRQVETPQALHARAAGAIYMGAVPVLDISSTRIRDLIARRGDPSFLLPERVLQIIHTERIYDE